MVQWLGLGVLTAGAPDSIPGQGTKIPQAMWHGQTTTVYSPFVLEARDLKPKRQLG